MWIPQLWLCVLYTMYHLLPFIPQITCETERSGSIVNRKFQSQYMMEENYVTLEWSIKLHSSPYVTSTFLSVLLCLNNITSSTWVATSCLKRDQYELFADELWRREIKYVEILPFIKVSWGVLAFTLKLFCKVKSCKFIALKGRVEMSAIFQPKTIDI